MNRSIILAVKTMEAIDRAMQADQGASYRQWLQKVLPHIGDAYRGEDDAFRSHLGASTVGDECARAIWYGFRWATRPHFDGRMLRLFNRGHLEEGRLIAALLMIGVQVYQQDENGNQFRISGAAGHYGGSGDGIGVGIPDLDPGTPAVLEFKTHNDKSFAKLKEEGVRDSKFEHYVQMQQYMRKMASPVALYTAANKNNDEIYMQLVPLDTAFADQMIERGEKIVWLHEPPPRLQGATPGWFACKFCDHRPVCHLNAAPDRNCRTCKYSQPITGDGTGQWQCNHPKWLACQIIDKKLQLTGCQEYEQKVM